MAEILVDIDAVPFLGETASLETHLPRIYSHDRFSLQFSHYQYPTSNVHGFIIRELSTNQQFLPDMRADPPRFGVVECAINPDNFEQWKQDWLFKGLNYQELVLAMGFPDVPFVCDEAILLGHSFGSVRRAWESTTSPNWVREMRNRGFRPNMDQWQRLIQPYNPFQPQ